MGVTVKLGRNDWEEGNVGIFNVADRSESRWQGSLYGGVGASLIVSEADGPVGGLGQVKVEDEG